MPEGRWPRLLLRAAALLVVMLLALGVTLFLLATARPRWYQPAAVDETRLAADKRELAEVLDAISVELNAGRPAVVVLDEAQVNRWLVAADSVAPEWLTPRLPPEWQDAALAFHKGAVRLGATVRRGDWRAVAWADVRIATDGGGVAFEIGRAHV